MVGPGSYNPKLEKVRRTQPSFNWSTSKTVRGDGIDRKINKYEPGPGQYNSSQMGGVTTGGGSVVD